MSFVYERSYRGPVKGVIVDWAGTTVDFGSRAPVQAFRETFAREGIEISAAEAREPMGLAKRDHILALTRIPRVAEAWRSKKNAEPTDADVDRMYAAFLPIQLECLKDYAGLIDGTLETVAFLREFHIKLGSTTGYSRELMEALRPEAKRQGFDPAVVITASDVPTGRPAPYMAFAAATRMGVYPPAAIVKLGDTIADIEEGLNAGMWTIGVSQTGNEMGLSHDELTALTPSDRAARTEAATARLARAGAHYVAHGIRECIPLINEIGRRLMRGEKP